MSIGVVSQTPQLRSEEKGDMARLVAVCREGEEDYQFLARQIPLFINDTLTVSYVYVLPDNYLVCFMDNFGSDQEAQVKVSRSAKALALQGLFGYTGTC